MSKTDPPVLQGVNQRIVAGLQSYPAEVAELAIKAIQLSEKLPLADVLEALRGQVRELVRKYGGEP